jgi:outer membrane protein TolC
LSKLDLRQIKSLLAQGTESSSQPPSAAQPTGAQLQLTLQESIAIALQHNLDIRIATLSRDAVQTGIPEAKAAFHPTLGAAFTAAEVRTVPEVGLASERNTQAATIFLDQAVPTGATVSVSSDFVRTETEGADRPERPREFEAAVAISVVQPLLRGGRVFVATRPIRDAEFDTRIEEARLNAEILKVIEDTKTAYYNAILFEKIIEVTEEAIRRDKTLIEASKALFEAGLVTKRDIFSAEIVLAKDTARLASAQADIASARNALLDVLGLPIATEVVLVDRDISFQPIVLEQDQWIATAVERRPEVLEIEEQLRQSLLNVRVAGNGVLPQLDLVASGARAQEGSTTGKAFELDGWSWSAGLAFSLPLGNVAARSVLTRAKIEHARLQHELLRTKRQVEIEVRTAVIRLRESLDRMRARQAGVENAQGKLEIAKARFALGAATNQDITDAQEDLLDAETDLLTAIVDYNIGLAELEARIAGPIQATNAPNSHRSPASKVAWARQNMGRR